MHRWPAITCKKLFSATWIHVRTSEPCRAHHAYVVPRLGQRTGDASRSVLFLHQAVQSIFYSGPRMPSRHRVLSQLHGGAAEGEVLLDRRGRHFLDGLVDLGGVVVQARLGVLVVGLEGGARGASASRARVSKGGCRRVQQRAGPARRRTGRPVTSQTLGRGKWDGGAAMLTTAPAASQGRGHRRPSASEERSGTGARRPVQVGTLGGTSS